MTAAESILERAVRLYEERRKLAVGIVTALAILISLGVFRKPELDWAQAIIATAGTYGIHRVPNRLTAKQVAAVTLAQLPAVALTVPGQAGGGGGGAADVSAPVTFTQGQTGATGPHPLPPHPKPGP